jgi:hypothetical protein
MSTHMHSEFYFLFQAKVDTQNAYDELIREVIISGKTVPESELIDLATKAMEAHAKFMSATAKMAHIRTSSW